MRLLLLQLRHATNLCILHFMPQQCVVGVVGSKRECMYGVEKMIKYYRKVESIKRKRKLNTYIRSKKKKQQHF